MDKKKDAEEIYTIALPGNIHTTELTLPLFTKEEHAVVFPTPPCFFQCSECGCDLPGERFAIEGTLFCRGCLAKTTEEKYIKRS